MDVEEVKPKTYPTNLLNKDWSKRKCYYLKGAHRLMTKIHEMEVKSDDVWLLSIPKSGTTWMQELLWLVLNNFDFETAKRVHLEIRSPYLDFDYLINEDVENALKPVENLKSPRLIKTHLPLPLMPSQFWRVKPKSVYIYRNPKDALVSEFYHLRNLGLHLHRTLDEYVAERIAKPSFLPFEHVTEFYALRNEPWLYYTSYECMKKNLPRIIEDICRFMERPINSEQMQQMLHHLSFEEMKKNPTTNHRWELEQMHHKLNLPHETHNFVRRGQVGSHKDELSPEGIEMMDRWIAQKLAPHQITLDDLLLLNEEPNV